MKYELKSIGVWAFTKVAFFVNVVLGFLAGIFYALMMIPLLVLPQAGGPFGGYGGFDFDGMSIGVLLIVLPILFSMGFGVFYTIGCIILVLVYNLFAKLVGGMEFTFSPVGEAPPPAGVAPVAPPPPPPPDTPPPPPVTPQQPPPRRSDDTDTDPMYPRDPDQRP